MDNPDAVAPTPGEQPEERLLDQAQMALERSDLKVAWARLRRIRVRRLTPPLKMRYHYLKGQAEFEAQRYSEAGRQLTTALTLAERLERREYTARIRYRIGVNLYRQRKFVEAERLFALCHTATIEGDVRDLLFRMYVDHSLGNCALRQGRFEGAVSHYRDALSYVSDVDDPRWVSSVYWGLGLAYLQSGEAAQAKIALEESLALAEDAATQSFMVEISAMYAVTLIKLNQANAAERELERTIYLSRAVGNNRTLAIAYSCLAEARMLDGQLPEALAAAEQAVVAAEQPGVDALDRAQVQLVVAKVHAAMGERIAAERIFEQAEAGMKGSGDDIKYADLLKEYARTLALWGETERGAAKLAAALGLLHPDWEMLPVAQAQ